MSVELNALQWDGQPGHYEVYYLSATDPESGCGLWIRYTMVAPLADTGQPATCSLWLMAMDPNEHHVQGHKRSYPIDALSASQDPFELRIADAVLTEAGMSGGFDDVRWDLQWEPRSRGYEHVHPFLRAARVAKTILVLPEADLAVSGTLKLGERELRLDGARGGQAHLWGAKHATRWSWAHCNDFRSIEGEPRPDCFVDGVSVIVPRMGREVGPSTPIVGRFLGEDFLSTSPRRVLANQSRFSLTSWQFEALHSNRKIVCHVDARRPELAGVTYHDPDGDLAYCYNSEVADMRVQVWDRSSRRQGWMLRDTLVASGRAHFEYAQRDPVAGLALHVT